MVLRDKSTFECLKAFKNNRILNVRYSVFACCRGYAKLPNVITLPFYGAVPDYIRRFLAIALRPPDDTAMSSHYHPDKLDDELQKAYNAVLLQIFDGLETDQRQKLYFYFTGRISTQTTQTLHVLRSLKDAGEISCLDVCSLKEAFRMIQRSDLETCLTAFEIKRDLIILLDFYAKMRRGSESRSRSSSVESVAGYLLNLMTEIVGNRFDVGNVRSLMMGPRRKSIRNLLIDFEEQIEREMSDPWSKLTCLVVIAGEMITEALVNEEPRSGKPEVAKLCSTAADMLSTRVINLGGWVS